MQRYQIIAPELRWQGKPLKAGASFEADDTIEVRTLIAIGHIVAMPQQVPAMTTTNTPQLVPQSQAPPPESPQPIDAPQASALETLRSEPPPRRRHVRRDQT